jgi:methylmalonyl-CoA/ethylmalonyl-CoA epimerase
MTAICAILFMALLPLPINHIGIAVTDLDATITHYQKMLGYTLLCREDLPSQEVRLAFLEAPHSQIELLTPLGSTGALARFLASRGAGLHHIAYTVPDIKKALSDYAAQGVRLIDITPRPGSRGSLIAFLHPDAMQGVLTELVQPARTTD